MDTDNAAHSPLAWHLRRPLSLEITPIEYDYYMNKAQQMRAEALAGVFDAWFAALRRLFTRAKPALHRREPVLVKSIRSRTA
ncbi:MAG TPA: hypothetical protein VIF14_05520 [Alphaproteobacteria bacterium]